MESWMISVAVGVLTYFSMLITMKNKTDQHSLDIKEIKEKGERHKKEDDILHGKMFDKLDEVNKELATHKVFIGNAPTMEQVRNEFVTKEIGTDPLAVIVGFPDIPSPLVIVIPEPAVSVLPLNVAAPSKETIPAVLIPKLFCTAIIPPPLFRLNL